MQPIYRVADLCTSHLDATRCTKLETLRTSEMTGVTGTQADVRTPRIDVTMLLTRTPGCPVPDIYSNYFASFDITKADHRKTSELKT